MTETKYLRASDREEFLAPQDTGFVERKRTVANPLLHYAILTIIVAAGAYLLVHYESPIGCVIAVVVGSIMTAFAFQSEKLKKMLQATEFLSALFSSALSSQHRFTMISSVAGDIVYSNRSFHTLYPGFTEKRSTRLADWFELAKIPASEGERILTLTTGSQNGSVPVTLTDTQGTSFGVTLEIESIERPTGFVMIRAK